MPGKSKSAAVFILRTSYWLNTHASNGQPIIESRRSGGNRRSPRAHSDGCSGRRWQAESMQSLLRLSRNKACTWPVVSEMQSTQWRNINICLATFPALWRTARRTAQSSSRRISSACEMLASKSRNLCSASHVGGLLRICPSSPINISILFFFFFLVRLLYLKLIIVNLIENINQNC